MLQLRNAFVGVILWTSSPFFGASDACKQAGTIAFSGPTDFSAGSFPAGVTSFDLDNDGDLDLAVTDFLSNAVVLLVNDGTGTFVLGETFPVGAAPYGILAGDLNNDGAAEILTADSQADTLSLLESMGNGLFRPSFPLKVGSEPWNSALIDLDRDGRLDIAAASHAEAGIFLQTNNGNLDFASLGKIPVRGGADRVASVDVDLDGKEDLVSLGTNALSLLSNEGNLKFKSPIEIGPGGDSFAFGDMNADHFPDIAMVSERISLLCSNGTGGFLRSIIDVDPGHNFFTLSSADMDADGVIDLILTDRDGSAMTVLPSQATCAFADPLIFSVTIGAEPIALTEADLNIDGFLDVVTANRIGKSISVFLSRPRGDDCNRNRKIDACDIESGLSNDCNVNGMPDECELRPEIDKDANGLPDACPRPLFNRGDPNGDGALDISDGLCILTALFEGVGSLECLESADANNDAGIDCSDSSFILGYLFLGTSAPPVPGPPPAPCGTDSDPVDSTGDLGCHSYPHCR